MNYPFDFSGLPLDAEVTSVEVKAYGVAESTSESYRHADLSDDVEMNKKVLQNSFQVLLTQQ